MLKKILSLTTIFLSLCLVTVDAATPKHSADEVVLAYAEMYTYGASENISVTGIPAEYYDEVKQNAEKYFMTAFRNYPLNEENYKTVQTKLFEKLHEVIKISTRLKVDDSENPVVELTVNGIDQKVVDELKNKDTDLKAFDVMLYMSSPKAVMNDEKCQAIAIKSILNLIDNLPVTEPKTLDVTCKLVEYEDNFYWMPEDVATLSKFVDPIFEVKSTDPRAIDETFAGMAGTAKNDTTSAGN